ncbi:MAG: tRNA (5-methylaminomethyl-2-thiouridine)(34)-methyltransferase MnmD [Trueperaceae bacterium]
MIQKTADGSNTLHSERYAQTFHSDKGALTESKHVFLESSDVAPNLRTRKRQRVLEVGFGTGLNFFLTADVALKHGAELHYTALEQTLLPTATVQELGYDTYLENKNVLESYLNVRKFLPEDVAEDCYIFEYKTVRLELLIGEATVQSLKLNSFDAIYQDAFSPDANPELWSEVFFKKLYDALKPNGKVATYSVKGNVRRTLQKVGFIVEKRPGPVSGKREMLVATKVTMDDGQ